MSPRLEGLFQYLNLLCNVNAVSESRPRTVESKILRTCNEIEKELAIPKYTDENDSTVNVSINSTKEQNPNELADTISKAILRIYGMDKAKMQGGI